MAKDKNSGPATIEPPKVEIQPEPAPVTPPVPAEPLPVDLHSDVLYWSFDRDELVSMRGIIVAKMLLDPTEFVLTVAAKTGEYWSRRVAKYSPVPKANCFTKFKPV